MSEKKIKIEACMIFLEQNSMLNLSTLMNAIYVTEENKRVYTNFTQLLDN